MIRYIVERETAHYKFNIYYKIYIIKVLNLLNIYHIMIYILSFKGILVIGNKV